MKQWPLIKPIAKISSEVKGVLGSLNQYFYSARIGTPKIVHSNRFFKAFYFPPSHLLGHFRKSTPALRVKFNDGFMINDQRYAKIEKNKFGKSLNPMDYSFIRVNTRRLLRESLLNNYKKLNGADGLYVLNMDVLPDAVEDLVELEGYMNTMLENVKKMDEKVFKISTINKRIQWEQVRNILKAEGYSFNEELESLARKFKK